MSNRPESTISPLAHALREKIIASAEAGDLGAAIDDIFRKEAFEDFKNIGAACADLHNTGEIDLLSLATPEALATVENHRFFERQMLFVAAIPGLRVGVPEMLNLVQALVARGGEDLAANQPNSALIGWLRDDLERARTVLRMATEGNQEATDHSTFALQALADVDKAQELVRTETGALRLSAFTALSRLSHTPAQAAATRKTVSNLLVECPDDGLSAHAIAALFHALATAFPDDELDAEDDLASCGQIGPHTQHQLAQMLWLHAGRLSVPTRARLFELIGVIDPAHKGILRTFDQALSQIFDVAADSATAACKRFLSTPENAHELAELTSFGTGLVRSPNFGATVLDWLLTGEHALCDGLHKLVQNRDRASAPLTLATVPEIGDEDALFIAYKAVGYFFTQPVVAASILVHLLRGREGEVAGVLEELLTEPLLSNYGGELRGYLDTIIESDPAFHRVASALKETDDRLDRLMAVGRIAELRPSATERQIERVRYSDQMRASFKEARKESVFFDLVSRSTVLHGKRTTSYRRFGDEPLQRFDMDLSSHGVSFELPRLEAADPIGLDYQILTYRSLDRSQM